MPKVRTVWLYMSSYFTAVHEQTVSQQCTHTTPNQWCMVNTAIQLSCGSIITCLVLLWIQWESWFIQYSMIYFHFWICFVTKEKYWFEIGDWIITLDKKTHFYLITVSFKLQKIIKFSFMKWFEIVYSKKSI